MTHYLAEYALFLAETLTIIIGIIAVFAAIIGLSAKGKNKKGISIEKLNDQYHEMRDTLNAKILDKKSLKSFHKQAKSQKKQQEKELQEKKRHKVFVLDFEGDTKASDVESLREEITAVLTIADQQDEVVVILNSPGGAVHSYGLAASQLARLRQKNIPLTVAVDKVAASGGYLMACVADKILAAPFAIIGSIGVVFQMPNFNRFLKKHNIDFEQITAGEFKRTITLFGENTEKDREKLRADLELIHQQFKEFIQNYRSHVDLEQVATGEYWLAEKAKTLNLVDSLMTSDDYLLEKQKICDIYRVKYETSKKLSEKIGKFIHATIEKYNSRLPF